MHQLSITFSLLKRGCYEFDCKVFWMGRKVGGFSDGEHIIIFWSMWVHGHEYIVFSAIWCYLHLPFPFRKNGFDSCICLFPRATYFAVLPSSFWTFYVIPGILHSFGGYWFMISGLLLTPCLESLQVSVFVLPASARPCFLAIDFLLHFACVCWTFGSLKPRARD